MRNSKNSQELFIPGLVHMMRSLGAKLLMTASIHERARKSSESKPVNDAVALADNVLSCSFLDVFGARCVTIESEGTFNRTGSQGGETIPGVISIGENNLFSINRDKLRGLIGFSSGKIQRPGISLFMFERNKLHRAYNEEVANLLQYKYAIPVDKKLSISAENSTIRIVPFDSNHSYELSEEQRPLHRTVLRTIDEFGKNKGTLYYKNLLLLFRVNDTEVSAKSSTWQELEAELANIDFAYDVLSHETLVCSWLDAVLGKVNSKEEKIILHRILEKCLKANINNLKSWKNVMGGSKNKTREVSHLDGRWLAKVMQTKPSKKVAFICWFAQLRGILRDCADCLVSKGKKIDAIRNSDSGENFIWTPEHERKYADIAKQISCSTLPNGGFTGDWSLEVVPGSVSDSLGSEIVETLTSPGEDYKRFSQGIGLPVLSNDNVQNEKITVGVPGWPGAPDEVTLENLLNWHGKANSRKKYQDYQQIRSHLHSVAVKTQTANLNNLKSSQYASLIDLPLLEMLAK
ncbi:MAG: hypothetical protein ACYC4Q_11025 [Victivallaceae bacterium]